MKKASKKEKQHSGISGFSMLHFVGIIFVISVLLNYSQWTLRLIRKWELPTEPFFSKINLLPEEADMSLTAYLIFSIGYIAFYIFIIIALERLRKSISLLSAKKLFVTEVSAGFKAAGRYFMTFVIGTFILDVALLAVASTGRPVLDLIATETVVFVILAYVLFFMSDIFEEGILLKEENDLTI